MSAQAGVARLLFGMGRDNVLPSRCFAYLDPRRSTPVFNIVLVGVFAWVGSLFLNYESAAELINFGAFMAFMGVNAAVIRQFYVMGDRGSRRLWADLLLPALGLIFCLIIWLHLQNLAKIIGALWFAIGLVYIGIKTRGFRQPPTSIDFSGL
jgi:amino acid transporter